MMYQMPAYRSFIQFLMIGGLSLLAYVFVLASGLSIEHFDVVQVMWVLAFFANWPHFMVSYQMFYGTHSQHLLRSPRFFGVGVIVPAVLALLMVAGTIMDWHLIYVGLLYSMFFLVGWHYIKQSYGCFVVYAISQGVRLSKTEQAIVKSSLYPLWMASFVKMFVAGGQRNYFGLAYSVPVLDGTIVYLINVIAVLGAAAIVSVFIRKKLAGGKLPGVIAFTPLVAIYLWLFPWFMNDVYFYMIPFFHSIQYMLFSGAFVKNKVAAAGQSEKEGILKWWGTAFILGALAFYIVPDRLDMADIYTGEMTGELFMLSFIVFINIHHYFIDSAMWRGDNPQVRKYVYFSNEKDGARPSRVSNSQAISRQ